MPREGVDFSETFALFAKFASIRLVIAMAAFYHAKLIYMDFD
jgi:hypothetical protein